MPQLTHDRTHEPKLTMAQTAARIARNRSALALTLHHHLMPREAEQVVREAVETIAAHEPELAHSASRLWPVAYMAVLYTWAPAVPEGQWGRCYPKRAMPHPLGVMVRAAVREVTRQAAARRLVAARVAA
jgi:hypothetical protein